MKNLNVIVTNKIARYLQRDGEIVCGNKDYQITFTFDADWEGYETKTARFVWNGKHMDIPFSGSVCQVPKITNANFVAVGVYAGDISTTTAAVIPCVRSIRCTGTEMYEGNPEVCRDQAIDAAERAEAAAAESGKAVAKALAKMTTQEAGDSETLVMSQKAVTELVADALGNDAPTYETVDSVDQMTDTTKQYVLASTGKVWAFTTKEVVVEHNAYDAVTAKFNYRIDAAGNLSTSGSNGALLLAKVEQGYDPDCIVTIKGAEGGIQKLEKHYSVYFMVDYYDDTGTWITQIQSAQLCGSSATDGTLPIIFKPFETSKSGEIDKIKTASSISIKLGIKVSTAISAEDCKGLVVNFSTKNTTKKVSSWGDSGFTPNEYNGNAFKTVNSVEEMTDTTRQYVLASTGTLWAYTTKEKYVRHNAYDANTAIFNNRFGNDTSTPIAPFVQQDGCVWFKTIEQEYDTNCRVTISGLEKLISIWGANETAQIYFGLAYCDETKTPFATANYGELWGTWTSQLDPTGILPITFKPFETSKTPLAEKFQNTKYIKMYVCVTDKVSISAADCEGLIVEFENKSGYQMVSEWADTELAPSQGGGGGGNYVTLLTKINENAAQIHELDKRVTAIESESGTVTIPSYWEETVAEKIKAVQALQEEGGADCFSFVWASDTHCTPKQTASGQYSTSINVGKIANRLMNDLNIPFFAVTGDLSADIGSISDPSIDKTDIDAFFDAIVLPVGKERVLLTLGNHDGTTYTSPQTNDKSISKATRFNWFMRPFCDDNKRIWGGGEYYYVDYPQGKIRFIALCSNNGSENIYRKNHYHGNQLKWLAEEALIAPKGYTVVVLSHFPSNETELGGSPANSDVLMAILTAFDTKNNYSGSADGVSISATYSNSDAILCGFFAGHIHNDTIDTSKGFPIITVDAAGNKTEIADRVFHNGTATETAFDIVSINKATRTIFLTRIGVGVDREIGY